MSEPAQYLYALKFASGLVKVGRTTRSPSRRLEEVRRQVGEPVDSHHVGECHKNQKPAEAALIKKCAAVAASRQKREWFYGLDFTEVCEWVNAICANPPPGRLCLPRQQGPDGRFLPYSAHT